MDKIKENDQQAYKDGIFTPTVVISFIIFGIWFFDAIGGGQFGFEEIIFRYAANAIGVVVGIPGIIFLTVFVIRYKLRIITNLAISVVFTLGCLSNFASVYFKPVGKFHLNELAKITRHDETARDQAQALLRNQKELTRFQWAQIMKDADDRKNQAEKSKAVKNILKGK